MQKVFSVPLDFVGAEFQTSVWKALLKIPFGQIRTYLTWHVGNESLQTKHAQNVSESIGMP
jgi:O6-methylguanine-DNA--protein-cysteine methyltransferase